MSVMDWGIGSEVALSSAFGPPVRDQAVFINAARVVISPLVEQVTSMCEFIWERFLFDF